MDTRQHPLPVGSLGQQWTLASLRLGAARPGAPRVYLQASLHADELPGMLVLHHLLPLLQQAEAQGLIDGEVVVVPVANPIGLAQRLDHRPMGRFELASSENFNRHYPVLADAIWPQVQAALGDDEARNVAAVRRAVAAYLDSWQPVTPLQGLRRELLRLAHDADVVIDLHCDGEALMHLYTERPCWPALEPLARALQCRTVLLAQDSGGSPFDECLSGLWWQLRQRLDAAGQSRLPLPQACHSTTVELRGEVDVSHEVAAQDAAALLRYLQATGVLRHPNGTAAEALRQALPALPCEPTPLAGSQTVTSPMAGVLVFLVPLGARLAPGDAVAEVIDPLGARVHTARAEVEGVLYARVRERYLHAGGEIGKIAGAQAFRTGALLGV